MKKLTLTLLILFLMIFSCSKDDPLGFAPEDLDGDGVTNKQEYFDHTDPNDPCSYNSSSQYPPLIHESWKLLDCDGDGVTNQQEIDDGTSLNSLCDYESNHQTLSITSSKWKSYDCDGDGVSNEKETIDGTNINDYCDFTPNHQDLTPIDSWLSMDCDEDGRTNENEILNNTNPLDPNDFYGSGDKIIQIKEGTNIHTFTENGALYNKIVNSNNIIISNFSYDSQKKLTSVFIKGYDNVDINISFSYTNNQISKITRVRDGEQTIYNIVYDNKIIYSYNDSDDLPNGIYSAKYTFNSKNKIIQEEHFRTIQYSTNTLSYTIKTFEYNSQENMIKSYKENKDYNINTQIYTDSTNTSDYFTVQNRYSYIDNVKNPMYNATQNIYIHYVLLREILLRTWTKKFDAFSNNFIDNYSYYTTYGVSTNSHTFSYGVDAVQTNEYPTLAHFNGHSIEFHYKN